MFLTNMTDDANIFIYRVWYCISYRTENKLFYLFIFYFILGPVWTAVRGTQAAAAQQHLPGGKALGSQRQISSG